MNSHGPLSYLTKRDGSGRRTGAVCRLGSRYKGVTRHSRTNRFEAHVWSEGKQVYLGGYGVEIQAATAYDIAACKFRGRDAQTNFDINRYVPELDDRHASREEVVQALRNQSKAMNCINHDSTVIMEAWELEISAIVHAEKEHLGVFADEREAARAVDRACIQRLGLEATTSFPLVDYLDILTADQIQTAVTRGLLPPTLPMSYSPPPVPRPFMQLPSVRVCTSEGARPRAGLGHAEFGASTAQSPATPEERALAAPRSPGTAEAGRGVEPGPAELTRRPSVTPRSVFDFVDLQTVLTGKRGLDADADACKRARLDSDEGEIWIKSHDGAMLDLGD